ncbi:MAG TPA: hypothetical protein VMQ17_01520 [Candidatus Sulfotelmatobacter sp.]|nr:hypothetical protein [Candidatus Sulfotelmatobacter sp.]
MREAAGRAAKGRIREQYQWQKIAADIEAAYFEIMGGKPVDAAPKKPSARAAAAGEGSGVERRAGVVVAILGGEQRRDPASFALTARGTSLSVG